MRQKSQIMQILSTNFYCFNLISLQIFFGFTLNTNLSIFKAKTRKRKLFCHQINQSGALFFLFQAVIGYISSNHGRVMLKTRAQVPTASSINCLDVLWICICERFLQRSGGYLLQKCTIFTGKKFHGSLKV